MNSFLSPPSFEDEEKNRLAHVQHAISMAAFSGLVILLLYRLVIGQFGIVVPLLITAILVFGSMMLSACLLCVFVFVRGFVLSGQFFRRYFANLCRL